MLIRANGARSGIKEYLERGQMKDRFYDRDQLDERVVLTGDLSLVDHIINNYENDGEKYFHFTLAFKEDYIDKDVLSQITTEFREFYFKGYTDEEISFYAEAHLPRLKAYKDRSTGEIVERKPHIHVVVPKINLLTGNSISFDERVNIKYTEAFQEYINCKYGLASPKDNRRSTFNNRSEMISRYKGDNFIGFGKEHKEKIFQMILKEQPKDLETLGEILKKNGYYIKVRNNNSNLSYLNVRALTEEKGVNLKEFVFSEEFLKLEYKLQQQYIKFKAENKGLSREERINLIELNKATSEIYVKAGFAREVPQVYLERLNEWHETISLQRKYIDRGSKSKRLAYKNLNIEDKRNLLKQLEQEFYKKAGVNNYELRESELEELVNLYRRAAFDNLQTAGINLRGIVEANEGVSSSEISSISREHLRRARDKYARLITKRQGRYHNDSLRHELSDTESRRHTVLDTLTIDYINEKLNREEFSPELKRLNQNVKADALLELLEKTHGIIPEKYQITINKDGQDRIKCGDRNYSVIDFCLKEMHLSWNDAIKLLRTTELMQREVDRERGYSIYNEQYLFSEYKNWLKDFKASRDLELANLQKEIKTKYDALKSNYKTKADELKNNNELAYHKKNEQRRLLKMEKLVESRALIAAKNKELEAIKLKYNLDMQQSYRKFLIERAILGDNQALLELRRLRIDFNEYKKDGAIKYVNRYQEYKLNITHDIDASGTITYKLTYYSQETNSNITKDIIKDIGKRIDVLDKDENNLKLSLDLAISKFGTQLELFGSEDFKKQTVEMAIKNNYQLTYKDEFSRNYSKQYIEELKANFINLENSTQEFLNTKLKLKQELLVADISKLGAINLNGKFVEVTKVTLFNMLNKQEYVINQSLFPELTNLTNVKKGDMLILEDDFNSNIKVNHYFWSKYISDLRQGVTVEHNNGEDELVIKLPAYRQTKYEKEYFLINQPGIIKKLDRIGYQYGDLISVLPAINLKHSTIDYEFKIIGESAFKLQAKREILQQDINKAKLELSQENANLNEITKEISGKVIDFGQGINKRQQSSYIILEDLEHKISLEALQAKQEFCAKHMVSLYNLGREYVGEVVDFGASKYNEKSQESFFIKLNTLNGEKSIWGKDLERMVKENDVHEGEKLYIVNIGEAYFKSQESNKIIARPYLKYECMRINEDLVLYTKDLLKSPYTRYWNSQFKELIDNKMLEKDKIVYIAKTGENTIKKTQVIREFAVKKINLELIKSELEQAKEEIKLKNNAGLFSKDAYGRILDFGKARYNENSSENHFIKIKEFNGEEKTFWGKDLERVIADNNLVKGEYAYLAKVGERSIAEGINFNKYDLKVLSNTTKHLNDIKSQVSDEFRISEDKFNKETVGKVVEFDTKLMPNGEKNSFIKIQDLRGNERIYWDKNLDLVINNIKKNDDVYFVQVHEQELQTEMVQDKFSVKVVGENLEQRALDLVKEEYEHLL